MTWILPQRRGCADLCPNGLSIHASFDDRSLITSRRHTYDCGGHTVRTVVSFECNVVAHISLFRVVLDATGHLHEHIAVIRDRVRTLQGALADAHGERSNEPHPLLVAPAESSEDEVEEAPEFTALTGAIADLELTDDGSTVFFGTAPSPLAAQVSGASLSRANARTPVSTMPVSMLPFQH
jgi:hypothetical protein